MKICLIKTSSMGDVIHTLPAVTDLLKAYPNAKIDWVVEESFSDIPSWHPGVHRVLPIAIRKWRKALLQKRTYQAIRQFTHDLKVQDYDIVLDAQGLLKSALVAKLAKGTRHGLDSQSIKEPLASFCYHSRHSVPKGQHAVSRVRELFAKTFGYDVTSLPLDYGIERSRLKLPKLVADNPYVIFLHATSWRTKEWPESYWVDLGQQMVQKNLRVLLPSGNEAEAARAGELAEQIGQGAMALSRYDLTKMAGLIANAKAVVAVDTGLGHLAAALSTPTLSLYGATNPALTGTQGHNQIHLAADFACAPCLSKKCSYKKSAPVWPACFVTVRPKTVGEQLAKVLL